MSRLSLLAAVSFAALTAACSTDGRGSVEGGGIESGSAMTDSGDGESGWASDSEDPGESGEDGARFDVGDGSGHDPDGGSCKGGDEFEFSHIWIANSWEGTVSKIDTVSGVELARYMAGPNMRPDPSRTSVNLLGDVAVVDRTGGITKIAARLEDCVDADQSGDITTSQGPDDILTWGEDECVLWHQELPAGSIDPEKNNGGPRPVAWEGGFDKETCSIDQNPRVWVGWYEEENDKGVFRRLDGATGQTLDEVEVEGWGETDYGPYGGAVDGEDDFWAIGWGSKGPTIHIDKETLEVERIPNPGGGSWFYGMALDKDSDPWVAGCNGNVYHWDREASTWQTVASTEGCLRGIQVDREGRAWIAANNPCRLMAVDTETGQVIDDQIPLPECQRPVGISIDVEGFVWVVDYLASKAFKFDPDTYQVTATVGGLRDPYTYSDMTGAGLKLVAMPPAG